MALSLRFSLINSSHNKRFSIFLWRKNNWKLKQKAEKEKQSAEREPQKKQWLSNSVFSPLNLQSCHLLLSSKSPLSDLPSSSWLPPSVLPLSEYLFPEPFNFFSWIISGSLCCFLFWSCFWIWVFVFTSYFWVLSVQTIDLWIVSNGFSFFIFKGFLYLCLIFLYCFVMLLFS